LWTFWQPTPDKQKLLSTYQQPSKCLRPNRYADQIEYFCRNVKKARLYVRPAYTLTTTVAVVSPRQKLGIMAGADRIEGTLLGNGERTGNMDIVTMAMNIYSQGH